MQIVTVTWENWNAAPWRPALGDAIDDYLRRSGEEITREEEWAMLANVMLGTAPDLRLLVAIEDDTFYGFCLLRAVPGTKVSGTLAHVWQAYVVPGKSSLVRLFEDAKPFIDQFAHACGASRVMMYTRRDGPGYRRLLKRIGFEPYATTFVRGVDA